MESTEIISKTAMVRILFEITSLPKKDQIFNNKQNLIIKKVDIFPLAFVYSEDCLIDNYSLISQAIHKESHKVLDNIPTCDPGMYEMVGEFFGKFSLQENEVLNQIWELSEIKAYQLTDEEIQLLPITLRPEASALKV
jgi:hypothetical protein